MDKLNLQLGDISENWAPVSDISEAMLKALAEVRLAIQRVESAQKPDSKPSSEAVLARLAYAEVLKSHPELIDSSQEFLLRFGCEADLRMVELAVALQRLQEAAADARLRVATELTKMDADLASADWASEYPDQLLPTITDNAVF
jgi:hypothetical protein